jgi:hypothetical protein
MRQILAVVCGLACGAGFGARAAAARVLVAPQVRPVGVDSGTAAALELLLVHEIESHPQVHLVAFPSTASHDRPCAEVHCAAQKAQAAGADAALLCSLTRLGKKLVVVAQSVDASGRVEWSRREETTSAENLDSIAARLGAELAAGFSGAPAELPASRDAAAAPGAGDERVRRHGWATSGPRVGAVYPLGSSFAGVPRLTSLAYTWCYQTPTFDVQTVPALGVAWGGDLKSDRGSARSWTVLDIYVGWTPFRGDLAPYAGAGLGLRALRLERDGTGQPFVGLRDQTAMALTFGLGGGLALFRSYDFQVGIDLRYERMLNSFAEVGGDGAQGLALTFGLQHR